MDMEVNKYILTKRGILIHQQRGEKDLRKEAMIFPGVTDSATVFDSLPQLVKDARG